MQCVGIAVRWTLKMNRNYNELIQLSSFEDRYRYLRLDGKIGVDTFGFDRVFNQKFYHSKEWKKVRDQVIVRDNGCDLGIRDRPIAGRIYIHHMNPITMDDIKDTSEYLLNPNYLICTSLITHEAIHYGNEHLLPAEPKERSRNDTCPWKK